MFKVTFSDAFLTDLKETKEYKPNSVSILEFVSERYSADREDVTVVYKHDDNTLFEVKPVLWSRIKPKTGEYLIYAKPKDKDTLRTALTIALVAAGGAFAVPFLAGTATTAGVLGLSGAAFGTAIVSAGVTMAATYLAQAIIPFQQPQTGNLSPKESSTLNITGSQNSIKAGAPIPYVIGTAKVIPPLAINPTREAQGNDVWLTQVFCFGYGPLEGLTESNLKIGDQPLTSYSDYSLEIQDRSDVAYSMRRYDVDAYNDALTNRITMVQGDVQDSAQNVLIKQVDGARIFTTAANTEELGVELSFNGLVAFDDSGARTNRSIDVELKYRRIGDSAWRAFDGGNLSGEVAATFVVETVLTTVQLLQRSGPERWTDPSNVTAYNYYIDIPSDQGFIVGNTIYIQRNGVNYNYYVYDVQNAGLRLKVGGFNIETGSFSSTYVKQYGSSFSSGSGVAYSTASTITITDSTAESTYRTYKASNIQKGVYEISVTRITADTTDSKIRDEFYLTNVRSIQKTDSNGNAIVPFPKEFCYVALKIKASDQLNGVINNLNCVVSSVTDIYDDVLGNFTSGTGSGNPAWEYLKLLTGTANKRYISPPSKVVGGVTVSDWDAILDMDAFIEWASVCDELVLSRDGITLEPRYRYNTVVDYSTTVGELAQKIATVGRAANSMLDGKYSIIHDATGKPAVARLTPANTYGFSSVKSYARIPDAFRCRFVNKDKNYNVDEVLVKRDDLAVLANDALIQDINCDGITDPDQVYRYAKYAMAQLVLRPEEYKLTTGIEHKYFRRGDVVSVTHDKIQGQVHYSRVKAINGNTITLDQTFQLETIGFFAFRYAGEETQDLSVYSVVSTTGNTFDSTTGFTFDSDTAPTFDQGFDSSPEVTLNSVPVELQVGDIAIGGTNAESLQKKYIVKNKIPKADDDCEIVLVDYADPDIFDAENGIIADYVAGDSSIVINNYSEPSAPVVTSVVTDERAILVGQDGSLETRAGFIVAQPEQLATVRAKRRPAFIEIQWRIVGGDSVYNKRTFEFTNAFMYISGLQDGQYYDFRLRFVTEFGIAGQFTNVSNELIIGKTSNPASVTGFSYIENREGILFTWDANLEIDVKEYEIREGFDWDAAAKIDRLKANQKLIDSRTSGSYTFLIKAVDVVGNYSEVATSLEVNTAKPANVTGFTYVENREGILLSWDQNTDIDFNEYEIREGASWVSATKIDRLKANQKLIESRKAGTYKLLIKAIDLSGDYSETATELHITTYKPSDVIGFVYTQQKDGILFSWTANTDIDIDQYEIRRGSSWDTATKIDALKANAKKIEPLQAGSYTYLIKAIDLVGDYSVNATNLVVTVQNPSQPSGVNSITLDNNVQLRWTEPASGFKIDYYKIYKSSTEFLTGEQEIGSTYTTFTQNWESSAGLYTYYIEPVDIVGNKGARASITVELDVPPDFVLIADDTLQLSNGTYSNGYAIQSADVTFDSDQLSFDSLESFTFDQDTTTNIQFLLDSTKPLNDFIVSLGLVGQFDSTDDFTFDSDSSITFDSGYSIQNLIDDGYDYWVQMASGSSGHYEIVVDYGTVIPSSKVSVFDKWNVLVDGLNKAYTVSSSLDNISYTDYIGKSQFLQSFRYIKIRIDITAKVGSFKPLETLEDLRVKLDLKRRYDGGSDTVSDANTGKTVFFTTTFLDVDSIVVTAKSAGTFRTAVYDFNEAGDQKSFICYLFDAAGNKVTGEFSWSAEGY